MPKNQPQLQFLIGNNDYNNNNEQKSKYPNVLEPDGIYHSPVSHVGVRPTTPKNQNKKQNNNNNNKSKYWINNTLSLCKFVIVVYHSTIQLLP